MKRFFITLIAALSFASASYATPLTFTDTTRFTESGTIESGDLQSYGGGTVNKLDGIGDYVFWKHFFTFAPPAAQILEGTLRLTLADDEGDIWWNPLTWEIGFGYAEDGQWDIGAVNSGTYVYGASISALEDGAFGVTLASLGGDFFITQSDLTITYEPVPEPSTILLLACGLLGIGCFARRRRTNT